MVFGSPKFYCSLALLFWFGICAWLSQSFCRGCSQGGYAVGQRICQYYLCSFVSAFFQRIFDSNSRQSFCRLECNLECWCRLFFWTEYRIRNIGLLFLPEHRSEHFYHYADSQPKACIGIADTNIRASIWLYLYLYSDKNRSRQLGCFGICFFWCTMFSADNNLYWYVLEW